MKKFIYMLSCIAVAAFLSSCEGKLDYSKTIDATEPLAFLYSGDANHQSATVVHTPSFSMTEYQLVVPVQCNCFSPVDGKVKVSFDAAASQAYAKELGVAVLPVENLSITKYVKPSADDPAEPQPSQSVELTLAKGKKYSVDSLQISLVGDLDALQEENYAVVVNLTSSDIKVSEELGKYYLLVNTVTRCIKPITSVDDIKGVMAADRATYTIVAPTGVTTPANLFDNKTNTYGIFPSASTHEVIVDMQSVKKLAGWGFAVGTSYNRVKYTFEYSLDNVTWTSFGPCSSADQYKSGNYYYFGLYAPIEARYFKFNTDFPYYSYGNTYKRYAEVYFYTAE